jgi:hypothetical protein
MTMRVLVSSSGNRRIARARAWLEAREPAEEVLIVGADLDAANEVARRVAQMKGAAFGWHRLALTQLAAVLAGPSLATRSIVSLSRLGTQAMAARVVHALAADGALGRYAGVAQGPGFARAIASVLMELRLAKVDRDHLGSVAPELAILLEMYESNLAEAGLTDWAGVLISATEAVMSGDLVHRLVGRPILLDRVGAVDGITLFDKVIQTRNRPKSNPIWAYDSAKRRKVEVEVFNGEIGIVQAFGFDNKIWNTLRSGYGPRLKRFAVQFTRKPGVTVGYGRDVPHDRKYKRNERVEDNLELAYAVSIHKAQGSEFADTFVIIPSSTARPVSAELVYTALTRANRHCTLFLQKDITSLLDARRRENAQAPQINSFLFSLHVAKDALIHRRSWYEAGKIHEALSGDMLRSKSEVIIANQLHEQNIPFRYEQPLFAGDGTLRLPDFTVTWKGKTFFWEHLGMLDLTEYAEEWKVKRAWYDRWFPGQLLTTEEGPHLSKSAAQMIETITTA